MELDRSDFIRLVRGSTIHRSLNNHPLILRFRGWVKGYDNVWLWKAVEIEKASAAELLELYILCKNSWADSGEEHKDFYPALHDKSIK